MGGARSENDILLSEVRYEEAEAVFSISSSE